MLGKHYRRSSQVLRKNVQLELRQISTFNSLKCKMSLIEISRYESFIYFAGWTGGILYSIYEVFLANNYLFRYATTYANFVPGWSWVGRPQDASDEEWATWIPLMIELMPFIAVHHIISYVLKATLRKMLLCYWYILMSVSFLYYYIGALGMLCALAQPILSYSLVYKRSKLGVWIVHTLFLLLIHFLKVPDGIFQTALAIDDRQHYILVLILCWSELRCISFTLDDIDNRSKDDYKSTNSLKEFCLKLAYCLYLPTLSLGPLILYHEFKECINREHQSLSLKQLGSFILNLIRYTFWILFTELALHFVYFNAIQYHPEIVKQLNPWALFGFGYCMGQFFLNKYVVVYGLNSALCEVDNIKAPGQPKCIGRIHLYSDMWKYFDRGLYKFLVRYIYIPMKQINDNKLVASFFCFTFVFLWHGMQISILVWSFLNFLGITIEACATFIGKTKKYTAIEKTYLSLRNIRRFHCMLASPLLAMSAVSNFYFFAGKEVGDIYVQRILLQDSWKVVLILLFFLYCCCQVSVDVKIFESRSKESKFSTLKRP